MPQLPASLWPAEIVPDRLRSASRPLILPDPKGMEPCLLVSSNLARIAELYSRRRHVWVHPTAPPAGIIRGRMADAGRRARQRSGWSLTKEYGLSSNAHERLSRFRNVRSCCGFWTPATTRRSTRSTSRRPKSAKARSRGKCGTWQSNERYEGRMSAPLSMVSATRARDEVSAVAPVGAELERHDDPGDDAKPEGDATTRVGTSPRATPDRS